MSLPVLNSQKKAALKAGSITLFLVSKMAPNLHDKYTGLIPTEPAQIINKPHIHQKLHPEVEVARHSERSNVSKIVDSLLPASVKSILPEDYSEVVWRNVLIQAYFHISAIYGFSLCFTRAQAITVLWGIFVGCTSILGVTCGAHRLWTHRTYKAKLPFRLILAFWQTVALQNSIFEWARDHRVHHKFTDTDADPHNSERGFFFSHMGWLMVKKHKDVITKGKSVDVSDLEEDPVVTFQRKYYIILALILSIGFPTFVPWYFWNESWTVCWYTCAMFRYVLSVNGTWCINSVCHIYGTKPFDKNIRAVENAWMGPIGFGEGWHNYHHVFPWDYKAAEFGTYRKNFSVAVIETMAKIGWAYDLKTVSLETVAKRATRTGDGSRKYEHILNKLYQDQHQRKADNNNIWGWDDKDMTEEERKITDITLVKSD